MAVSSESGSEDVVWMSHVAGRSDETWGEWDQLFHARVPWHYTSFLEQWH